MTADIYLLCVVCVGWAGEGEGYEWRKEEVKIALAQKRIAALEWSRGNSGQAYDKYREEWKKVKCVVN